MTVSYKIKNMINVAAIGIVVFGVLGTMYGSVYMGGQVLPSERNIIKALNKLPNDAVIVSTQVNQNLVEIYGKKSIFQLILVALLITMN